VDGLEGREAIVRYLFEPTLNLDGIWSGYTGAGTKTILPHKAVAKLDSRLPPNLEPDDAYAMIRHTSTAGFADLILRPMSGYPPPTPSRRAGAGGDQRWNKYGASPRCRSGWAAAHRLPVHRVLGLPFVFGAPATGPPACADEYMLIHPAEGIEAAGLADVEKSYVDMLYALAEMQD
jgi:acetylornithine deacetylase/succinyl-diaminopimelate desuccinylase-like protein